MTFKEALKSFRDRKQLTQRDAADRIPKLSVRSLQEGESGRQLPPPWAQLLILEAIGGAPNGFQGEEKLSTVQD